MNKKKVLIGTGNEAKIIEIGKFLSLYGIESVSPRELGIDIDPDETGNTLEENALIKLRAYQEVAPGMFVIVDDAGLEIDALGGEPDIHVRRWKDKQTRMTDEEIIGYAMERLSGVPLERRSARFRSVAALAKPNGETEFAVGELSGFIMEKPADFRMPGFPFAPIFYISEWSMTLGEAHGLAPEKNSQRLSHREKALLKLIPTIQKES